MFQETTCMRVVRCWEALKSTSGTHSESHEV